MDWTTYALQQERRRLHDERMGPSTSASFSDAEFPRKHYAERETESKIDVENGSISKDEFDPDLDRGRAPLTLRQVVGPIARERAEHDRLHLRYRSRCHV